MKHLSMNLVGRSYSIRPVIETRGRLFHSTAPRKFELLTVLEPVHHGLQYIHSTGGYSWHFIIPAAAIALRSCVTLPLSIANRLRARRQARLQPLLGASTPILKARLANSPAMKNGTLTQEQMEVLVNKERRNRRVQLFKENKCQVWKSVLILPSIQIPLWITLSLVIRAMCGWSVLDGIPLEEGFRTDSFLWYSNLIQPDPYAVMPVAIGTTALINMEWNAMQLNPSQSKSKGPTVPRILTNVSRFGVLFLMTMAFQAPSGVCLYWLTSHAFSLVQNVVLDLYLPINKPPQKDTVSSKTLEIQN